MSKGKFFTAVITVVISGIILFVIINMIFDSSKINQGGYRISDVLLTSVVELEDKSETVSEWKFDASQNNTISMLVASNSNTDIKEVYIEKFKISSKKDVNIYVEQEKHEISYKYEDIKGKKANIYAEETADGNYLVEFNINNEAVLSNYKIPEGVKEIRHDGTILNIASIPVSDVSFDVKYRLVIVENSGKINTCKVKLKIPNEKLVTEGLSIERLNSTDFNFKVEY